MVVTGESLQLFLQKRMRQLETDACKRFIVWKDEKCNSADAIYTVIKPQKSTWLFQIFVPRRALHYVRYFRCRPGSDGGEAWLQDRSTFLRPLSIDCCEIEEENKGLEQQWKSYALLGEQLNQLLSGLDVSKKIKEVLKNLELARETLWERVRNWLQLQWTSFFF